MANLSLDQPGEHVLAPYQNARALVTGASGFIGRWVARALVRAGADVVVTARDADALHALRRDYEIRGTTAVVDLSDEAALEALVRDVAPAVTFHLAGYGVDPTERDAAEARRINALSVGWIADAIARWGDRSWRGAQLIHAGTALEYGAAKGNLSEGTAPHPTTVYGLTKLEGAMSLMERCARGDLRAVSARLFTVYGPGEHQARLLPSLIKAAHRGERIALTSGAQRRDFTYVEDVAEGLLRVGVAEAPAGCLVNVATGELTTVRSFVEIAARILGLPTGHLDFGALPDRREEMAHDPVTIARLRRLTSWQPGVGIAEGVRATVAFLAGSDEEGAPAARSTTRPGDAK
jgi:nucleoside-diphosphate-sugar epimerase